MSVMNRRRFTLTSAGLLGAAAGVSFGDEEDKAPGQPVEAEFRRDYEPPSFKPSWKKPQLSRMMVQDFVIFAHSDLEMTTKLLQREPALIHAALDWGAGDFETALGGASHMGRRDIVTHLLRHGARVDIFCAAMLGLVDVVQSFLELEPALIDARGPHGFTLHFHAQVGQEQARPVLDYLQSIRKVELRPVPFLRKKPKGGATRGQEKPASDG